MLTFEAWKEIPLPQQSSLYLRHTSGISTYPMDRLYQEMAFLAYYLHWSTEELLALDHRERRRWCSEVSAIHQKLSGTEKQTFELR